MKERYKHIIKRLKISGSFFLLVSLFVLIVCWDRIVITTAPGHGGVVWHLLFGGARTHEKSMGEGLHLVLPWNRVYDYDLRLQNYHTTYNAVTKDGLQVKIGAGFRWRANSEHLGTLHQTLGPAYRDTLIVPAIGSITRHVISRYNASDLVSEGRNAIQQEIYNAATSNGVENGIGGMADKGNVVLLEDILIYNVELPRPVQRAIEDKLRQAQLVEEYRYRVQSEELESKRKEVEAQGIRRFQEIVASGMSNSYLRWRGIEATVELARSPNSKIVVVGSTQSGGLPLILDTAEPADKPRNKPATTPAKAGSKAKQAPPKKPHGQ